MRAPRGQLGREPQPSAGIVDSQSVKTTSVGGPRGDDGGKKVNGRQRHLFVDTQGLVCHAVVQSAGIMDRDGIQLLREPVEGEFPSMERTSSPRSRLRCAAPLGLALAALAGLRLTSGCRSTRTL
jgi:hypothetical protein